MRTLSTRSSSTLEPDLEAVAEERRLDLRVDHAAHRLAHEQREDLEVLPAAVEHDR